MSEASGSKKLISLICLIGGAILLVAGLALDFMGTKASYRGALLVIGIIGVLVGMYILPTLKHHRTLVYVVFLFPLLFAFVVLSRTGTASATRSLWDSRTMRECSSRPAFCGRSC